MSQEELEGIKSDRRMRTSMTMEQFVPGTSFSVYIVKLKAFFSVNEVPEESKINVLITLLPSVVVEKLINLCEPEGFEKKNIEELLALIQNFYNPRKNVILERFEFNKNKQEVNEPLKDFIMKLKKSATNCKFETFLDDMLRDRFIFGVKDTSVQLMLLMESTKNEKLTFAEASKLAVATELSESGVSEIKSENSKYIISQVNRNNLQNNQPNRAMFNKKNNFPNNNHQNWRMNTCSRCGISGHAEQKCSAKDFNCRKCGVKGHYEKVCRSKSIKAVDNNLYQDEDDYQNGLFKWIGALGNNENRGLFINVLLDGRLTKMEIDTGACSSVITYDTFKKMFPNKITSILESSLYTVTGERIKIMGKTQVAVKLSGDREEDVGLELIIINSDKNFVPLFGRSWLDKLIPKWRNNLMDHEIIAKCNQSGNFERENMVSDKDVSFLRRMKEKYPKAFSESKHDSIKGYEAEIHMKKNVVPIFCKPYSLPFPKKEQVEKELERLCKEGILIPVENSAWATPIVVAPKENNEIRICMDCKVTINKYISTQYYPMPRIDDIFAELSGYRIYAKIDLKGAYLQLKMSNTSRKYVTINTHKGLFQYTRLPFGVSSAPAIFQSTMEQIFKDIKGVKIYLDDILIGGRNEVELNETLMKVFEKLNAHHVKVNESKCEFFKKEVKYLGHIISAEGVKPNPKKVEAIKRAPRPKDINQLRSYLGIVNYYSHFIPNLSTKLNPLYKLLQKDVKYEWSNECDNIFEESKSYLMGNMVLELYDPTKPVIICADASPYGYGAILAHVINGVEKPVLFASCTLNDHERGYSQIHREAGAIMFAFHKFHKYVYGLKVTVVSDHEPLKEIFSPDKCNSAVALGRLKRWSVILSMYEYEFKHRPGKMMGHVDALSRLPLNEKSGFDEEFEINSINFVTELSKVPLNFQSLVEDQKQDQTLRKVYECVING